MNRNEKIQSTRLFQIGALWNIFIVGSIMLHFPMINKLVFGFDTATPYGPATFVPPLTYLPIFVFVIGYYFVSTDLAPNRGIAWMGMMSNTAYFSGKQVSTLCIPLAIGALFFDVLFGIFIIKAPHKNKAKFGLYGSSN